MKISLKGVTKIFPSQGKKKGENVVAVSDFTFDIPDGNLVSLLGPSGCGKSTTLYIICGLESPTSGQIFFGDTDITKVEPEDRGIGMVFQNYALYPHLTVRQNIKFPLENLRGKDRLSKEEIERRVASTAKTVQIEDYLDRKPAQLSGGQQQRVAIARAIVKLPNVLLLDEPLSNLDARLRLQTREEIRRIQKETKITTVFVTHDQEEAMSISDLIILMKSGVIQQSGKPQEVYDNPKNLFVAKFLGNPPINIFHGRIENNTLYIGGDAVYKIKNAADGKVTVGIRPEGLVPDAKGVLSCRTTAVGVMGRDTVVTAENSECETSVRAIIDSDDSSKVEGTAVKFNVKPKKLFIFDTKTEKRLYAEDIL